MPPLMAQGQESSLFHSVGQQPPVAFLLGRQLEAQIHFGGLPVEDRGAFAKGRKPHVQFFAATVDDGNIHSDAVIVHGAFVRVGHVVFEGGALHLRVHLPGDASGPGGIQDLQRQIGTLRFQVGLGPGQLDGHHFSQVGRLESVVKILPEKIFFGVRIDQIDLNRRIDGAHIHQAGTNEALLDLIGQTRPWRNHEQAENQGSAACRINHVIDP